MPRFGLNMMLWTGEVGEEHFKYFGLIKEWGYACVEIPLLTDAALEAAPILGAAVKEAGLACTASTAMPQEASLTRAGEAQRGVDWLRRCIDATRTLGGSVLCGPLYSPVGFFTGERRTAEEWDRCVQALREAGAYARAQGVLLAVEPLNRFETYFLNTVEDGKRLVDAVGSESVRLLLDTFHMNIEERDVASALRGARGYVGHFHCSENDRGPVGAGHVPWADVAAALKEIAYDGWCVVESFNARLKELARAACIWRDLSNSEEELARASLAFLQDRFE